MNREFVLNCIRKLVITRDSSGQLINDRNQFKVADYSSANEEFSELPLEGLLTLMKIINKRLRDDYRSNGKGSHTQLVA